MTEGNLTHRDLARMLGVSETTVKSYRRKFPDCIPVASQGKPIRFTAEAAAVSLRIRDLFEMGMSVEEVRARLALEFAWIAPEAPAQGQDEGDEPVAPPQPARVELPQDFTLAVSNLAKSMVGLTQQQNAILKRVQHVETLLGGLAQGGEGTAGPAGTSGRPVWLDEAQALADRFEALLCALSADAAQGVPMASAISAPTRSGASPLPGTPGTPMTPQTDASPADATAESTGADGPDNAASPSGSGGSAGSGGSGGRVVPFPGGMATPVADAPESSYPVPQDPPRHLLALPLVVQSPQGEFLGVAGRARGRFCINDLKAMLAFAFQPPDHYALRGETAEDGGWWLTLEQPQAAEPYDVVLLVDESVTPRGNQVAVVRRYIANGVEAHPTEIYGFLRAVQG